MKGIPNNKKKASPVAVPGVDVEQLEQLLAFMALHGLEEFEYEHKGLHIRLKKASANTSSQSQGSFAPDLSSSPSMVAAPSGSSVSAIPAGSQPAASAAAAAAPAEELHIIKSPIVGTFYGAPSPESPSFVKPGDSVQAGQVVCIVEAMKLMNEIEADVSGEVVRALIENGQPVEYGQGLFAIRPVKKK